MPHIIHNQSLSQYTKRFQVIRPWCILFTLFVAYFVFTPKGTLCSLHHKAFILLTSGTTLFFFHCKCQCSIAPSRAHTYTTLIALISSLWSSFQEILLYLFISTSRQGCNGNFSHKPRGTLVSFYKVKDIMSFYSSLYNINVTNKKSGREHKHSIVVPTLKSNIFDKEPQP